MSEIDRNPLPRFDLLPHPLRRVGRAVTYLFTMHQLADHGEHFVDAPLDAPVEPVTSLPDNRADLAAQEARMEEYWRGWEAGKVT